MSHIAFHCYNRGATGVVMANFTAKILRYSFFVRYYILIEWHFRQKKRYFVVYNLSLHPQ